MTRPITRRFLLAGAMSAFGTHALAGAPDVSLRPHARPDGLLLPPEPEALIDAARLGGEVGYAVFDMTTGALLEARNGTDGFPPASVTKTITALYALRTLGTTYRFATTLVATGPVLDGKIQGDLVLVGGGDPELDTDALATMAANLAEAGVTGLTGTFRTYGAALPYERTIDAAQPDQVGYNPALSGLNLNFNRVHFQWERGEDDYTVTMDARSARYRPAVRVSRMRIEKRSGPIYTYADAGDYDQWTVSRRALGKSGARWLPVRRPASYAGEVFATLARAEGIEIGSNAAIQDEPPGGTVLARHQSRPLPEILRGMLKYSNNLTAELVGLTATTARGGLPASLSASAASMTDWARSDLGLSEATLVDHSGLGDRSRVSPQGLARALALARQEAELHAMLKPFRMRDSAGRIDKGHSISVEAKTGTLHFVSALAGYATGPSGRPLAFAIFTHEADRRAAIAGSKDDRPPGASAWNRRAKILQQALIERWDAVYGA